MITVLLAPGDVVADQMVELDLDEAHHLRVRRARDGEPLELRDGRGLVGHGVLRWNGKRASVEVADVARLPAPPALTLAVGAGDRERFAWLVEKAAEVGVTDLLPMVTTLTRGVATRVRGDGLERFQRRAREAVKQSGAAWAPRVHEPVSLVQLPHGGPGRWWLADPRGDLPPVRLGPEPITVAIGPEGGLTDQERATLLGAGYEPVRLGAHIQRFETAALVAAAAVGLARLRGTQAAVSGIAADDDDEEDADG
ncbi:MAG TPA: RsmE family RNA methyltransferase [Gemmatimonadales bacterium]|nr:RsmE family RNA methyltransferase [Gemmatimonadales bacterium]